MWWYHTNLDATHPYQYQWWSWPLLIRPIWLYTSGLVEGKIANIYGMGNPVFFWSGFTAFLISIYIFISKRSKNLGLVIFSYLIFFAPWAVSPRIMFFYHYQPSLPFLAILLSYVLRRNFKLLLVLLFVCIISYIYFFPHWAGLMIPKGLDDSYYWMESWR